MNEQADSLVAGAWEAESLGFGADATVDFCDRHSIGGVPLDDIEKPWGQPWRELHRRILASSA